MSSVIRPDWDSWFLDIANTVSKRADCRRRTVGSVIVKDGHVVSMGYNGYLPGEVGCLAGACPRAFSSVEPGSQYATGPGECRSIHSEINSLLYAAKHGIAVDGASIFITTDPCFTCSRLIQQAGIVRAVWPEGEACFLTKTT